MPKYKIYMIYSNEHNDYELKYFIKFQTKVAYDLELLRLKHWTIEHILSQSAELIREN